MFTSDFAAGIKLPIGLANKRRRSASHRGWPDLFIAVPRGDLGGLFVELKRDGTAILKANGEFVADPHVREQAAVLKTLRGVGYAADFGVGFEQTCALIDEYLTQIPRD